MHALCQKYSSKFIQIGTDCIFSGSKGQYTEADILESIDLYGKSKFLGESGPKNALVLKTSSIGWEVETKKGLLEWFLSQQECCGYD